MLVFQEKVYSRLVVTLFHWEDKNYCNCEDDPILSLFIVLLDVVLKPVLHDIC